MLVQIYRIYAYIAIITHSINQLKVAIIAIKARNAFNSTESNVIIIAR